MLVDVRVIDDVVTVGQVINIVVVVVNSGQNRERSDSWFVGNRRGWKEEADKFRERKPITIIIIITATKAATIAMTMAISVTTTTMMMTESTGKR